VDEAAAEEVPDTFYIEALSANERKRKAIRSQFADKREDAELDVIAARRELWRATLQVARLEGTVEAALSVPRG
jgi:hypothetical protein